MNPIRHTWRVLAALAPIALLLAACGVDSGGTGETAKTSSEGRIAGFGSVIVNGIRFDDSQASIVDDDGVAHVSSELKLGMVVDVEGELQGNSGNGVARSIQFGNEITRAFIYGSIAREKEQAHSDVDLMVIGSISTADLVPLLKRLEESFQREINVTRYSEKEFKQKLQNKDHFLLSVLNEKVVMIKGAQDELEAAARTT